MALDSSKIARLMDGVNCISQRFDAMCAKDAAVTPSEYKALIKERDKAKAALAAAYEKAKTHRYAGLNFRNLEETYTRASAALAKAQIEMSKS